MREASQDILDVTIKEANQLQQTKLPDELYSEDWGVIASKIKDKFELKKFTELMQLKMEMKKTGMNYIERLHNSKTEIIQNQHYIYSSTPSIEETIAENDRMIKERQMLKEIEAMHNKPAQSDNPTIH